MGGLNSKQIADIKKGKTNELILSNQRKDTIQKKLYTLSTTRAWDLSNNFLTSISHRINSLTLTSLNLSQNDFEVFPLPLCTLVSLSTLDLSYNFLTFIPSEISELSSLTSLNLSFNKIIELNPDIGNLPSLKILKLSNNYIEKIPDALSHLRTIKLLSFSHNKISTFPKILWPTLEEFNLSSNLLHSVSYPFLIQPSLRVLFLSHNKLTSFPPHTSGNNNPPSNLKELYLNNNQITELTSNIYFFPKLEMVDLKGNLLKGLPFELFVHSPLIRVLDICYNKGCKWGLHMPNTFSNNTFVRDIHISKNQRDEVERGSLQGVHSESDTDTESPNRHRKKKQSSNNDTPPLPPGPIHMPSPLNDLPAPPSPQVSSPSLSPSPPQVSSPFPPPPSPHEEAPATSSLAHSASNVNSTTISSILTTEPLATSPPIGGDGKKRRKKRITFKHAKRYNHNKKRLRVIEHDHTVWEPAVVSHAAHLAELAVWSGAPCTNVTEEIKKELLQMTLIRPGLFLSSRYAAQDRDTLHVNNITHILVVGLELVPAFPTEFEYYQLGVRDNAIVDDLSLYFPVCQKFIDTGRKKGGVLVHCAAGSSRSASCIMAYLMWSEGISFTKARKELKKLRPIVKTNFYLQLEFYEGLLKAQSKRKRTKSQQPQTPHMHAKPKMVRSTSLPTIDTLHSFKLQASTLEDSPPPNPAPQPLYVGKLNLPSLNLNIIGEKPHSPRMIFSPRGAGAENHGISPKEGKTSPLYHPRLVRRSSRSLYSDLRVGMSDSAEPSSPTSKDPPKKPETPVHAKGPKVKPIEEEIGEGVPDSVIRQATDFEQRSEIHQLMRVHSLQDLMGTSPRRVSKSTSSKYLKNSKINLLEESLSHGQLENYREKKGESSGKPKPELGERNEVKDSTGSMEGEEGEMKKGEDSGDTIRFSPGFSDEVPAGIDEIVDPNEIEVGYEKRLSEISISEKEKEWKDGHQSSNNKVEETRIK